MKIGVDIGGTFMDFCAYNTKTNQLHSLKILTTPSKPGVDLLNGLKLLKDQHDIHPEDIETFVHGTTVGINTIIQRKGAKLALFTTSGFEDVIELARLRMTDVYSLFCSRPEQLVSRDMVFGVTERIRADGTIDEVLDIASVETAARNAQAQGAEGIIISFLHSYRNAEHEEAAKEIIGKVTPELFTFTSSEVWPVIREYERTTTTILNGYVHPHIAGYLDSIGKTLLDQGVTALPMLTKSNGGLMNIEAGKTNCVSMLLSGTASGVIGAAFVGKQAGVKDILTLDIGGTSADMAMIIDGEPQFGSGEVIGEFPLFVPSVSVTSIGSGGGSIAWVDQVGVLRVGPQSAGSTPGPACFGGGGKEPTITDAMAVCGIIGQAPIAYNQIKIDLDSAHRAVGKLAKLISRTTQETAEAIIKIAISEIFLEVNKVIARFGVDPRKFALMPFGGAGPMFGCFLAREIGCSHVIIPRRPGVVCALGGLVADIKGDFIQTVFATVEKDALSGLVVTLKKLQDKASEWLYGEQGYTGKSTINVSADMRYHGQSFEIDVSIEGDWIMNGDVKNICDAFHNAHKKLYDFNDIEAKVQIVNLRVVIFGTSIELSLAAQEVVIGTPVAERDIEVWLDGKLCSVPLYDRKKLKNGQSFQGPAVVSQEDSTVCILEGFSATIDAQINLHLKL